MKGERIHLDPLDECFWECNCGNSIAGTGFFPCAADGEEIPAWEAKLQCCVDCGRIIEPATLEVVGYADNIDGAKSPSLSINIKS